MSSPESEFKPSELIYLALGALEEAERSRFVQPSMDVYRSDKRARRARVARAVEPADIEC